MSKCALVEWQSPRIFKNAAEMREAYGEPKGAWEGWFYQRPVVLIRAVPGEAKV